MHIVGSDESEVGTENPVVTLGVMRIKSFWFSELHRGFMIWAVDTEEEDDVGRGRRKSVTWTTEVYIP